MKQPRDECLQNKYMYGIDGMYLQVFTGHLVHQLRAENLGLWLTWGEQLKHVLSQSLTTRHHKNAWQQGKNSNFHPVNRITNLAPHTLLLLPSWILGESSKVVCIPLMWTNHVSNANFKRTGTTNMMSICSSAWIMSTWCHEWRHNAWLLVTIWSFYTYNYCKNIVGYSSQNYFMKRGQEDKILNCKFVETKPSNSFAVSYIQPQFPNIRSHKQKCESAAWSDQWWMNALYAVVRVLHVVG